MIGSRLGPYEITAKLGEGGMGAVHPATVQGATGASAMTLVLDGAAELPR